MAGQGDGTLEGAVYGLLQPQTLYIRMEDPV